MLGQSPFLIILDQDDKRCGHFHSHISHPKTLRTFCDCLAAIALMYYDERGIMMNEASGCLRKARNFASSEGCEKTWSF